jgi:hypothetical protein
MPQWFRQRQRGGAGDGGLLSLLSTALSTTTGMVTRRLVLLVCNKALVLTLLLLVVGWHLFIQKSPAYLSTTATATTSSQPTPPTPLLSSSTQLPGGTLWWQSYLEKSLAQGPMTIPLMPFTVSLKNNEAIIQILKHYHIDPLAKKQQQQKLQQQNYHYTIIDIGLPSESILFAQHGYFVHAFEARKEGIQRVQNGISQSLPFTLQQHIILHHTALSNVSNTTMDMYDASDSSSLLSSALQGKQEKEKFEKFGQTIEKVQVEQLDTFLFPTTTSTTTTQTTSSTTTTTTPLTRIVAMKIDTQGLEPEIFMGSRQLLTTTTTGSSSSSSSSPPLVIVTEYCTRLRVYEELSVGPHLLRGLGYTCYIRPQGKSIKPLTLSPQLNYCGDFVCIHYPTTAQWQQ